MTRLMFTRAALGAVLITLRGAPQAAASKSLELHSSFGQLAPGDQVEADAEDWTLETTLGPVSCIANSSYDGTYGLDLSNGEKTDKISVGATEEGLFESQCASTLPFAAPAVAFNLNGNTLGDEARDTFSLGASGKAEFKSSGHLEYAVKVEWRGEFPVPSLHVGSRQTQRRRVGVSWGALGDLRQTEAQARGGKLDRVPENGRVHPRATELVGPLARKRIADRRRSRRLTDRGRCRPPPEAADGSAATR